MIILVIFLDINSKNMLDQKINKTLRRVCILLIFKYNSNFKALVISRKYWALEQLFTYLSYLE